MMDGNRYLICVSIDEPRPGESPPRKHWTAGMRFSEEEMRAAVDHLDPGGEGTACERARRVIDRALNSVATAAGRSA